MWLFPIGILALTIALAVPLGRFMAWLFEGKYRAPGLLRRVEGWIDTGPMNWKVYCLSLVGFNIVVFLIGFAVLALQPLLPLNPDHKGMLAPSTIFNTACSFLTNTNLQHYAGEVHLSYFSQIFFVCWKQFLTPAIGLAALVAMIRGLRGDEQMGNFYLDLWRGVVYLLLPMCLILGILLLACGIPMTLEGNLEVTALEGQKQVIARGPVAAIVAIKQLGTNGGGFFGVNSAHPLENPNAVSNILECVSIILIPIAALVMFGRMLKATRHALVIGGVMMVLSVLTIVWAIATDTARPNPALQAHHSREYRIPDPASDDGMRSLSVEQLPALPVDQGPGNLEGKELRFGTSAGATWAALTTNTSNGSVNCMHDSLNPLAGLTPLFGMWLNCIWGGIGVGLINMLVYLITGVFLAGLMVGRTPEYLGKKVEAREMKLAMLALLIHPILILAPTGVFAFKNWNDGSTNTAGPHAFSGMLYEFTSASANNGSGFEGLGDTVGFNKTEKPPPKHAVHWDLATGVVMLLGRFVPIIAPLALVGGLARKRRTPFTSGTLRTDTLTFGALLLGTILLVGLLLFLPAAVLGPVAEHLGPMPFGK